MLDVREEWIDQLVYRKGNDQQQLSQCTRLSGVELPCESNRLSEVVI